MNDEVANHLARAGEFMKDARLLLDNRAFSSSISRSYYAAFHSAKAVLSELGVERKSHQAVWAEFGQRVAKTGLIDRKFHILGVKLFTSRMQSDYSPSPNDTEEDARHSLAFGHEFLAACRTFLEDSGKGQGMVIPPA